MKSPADLKFIKIDITNDCFNQCSNCWKFSGNHKKIIHMDWNVFKRACESFNGLRYEGIVGITGGEPTLHPDFEKFVRYYDNGISPSFDKLYDEKTPIDDINQYQGMFRNYKPGQRSGLWTNIGPGYAKHFELINSVFQYQCINDHKSNILHQVGMITRKELNIPDDKWEKLRDNCWFQNNQSASITQKGAFFCEIAGALDLLFDGPGGWPIELDWWQRKPEDFKDQLHWCELCSFCLKTPYIPAHENTDIVSPEWDKKLNEIGSKKKRIIFDVSSYDPGKYHLDHYIEKSKQVQNLDMDTSRYLRTNKVILIMVANYDSDTLKWTLFYNKDEADEIIVVTEESDVDTIKICEKYKAHIVLSDKKHLNDAFFNKGAMINDGIEYAKNKLNASWLITINVDIILPVNFKYSVRNMILNPGTLYYAKKSSIKKEEVSEYLANPYKFRGSAIEEPSCGKFYVGGYFQLFNLNAQILKNRIKPYSEEFLSAESADEEFLRLWHRNGNYFIGFRLIQIY